MITADHVTAAIVRSCKATGEDVADVVGKAQGMRARHYAMHALMHVFAITGHDAARLVGCWADPRQFYNNSYAQTFKKWDDGSRRMAKWFDDAVFDEVIKTIEAVVAKPDAVAVAVEAGRQMKRASRRHRKVFVPPPHVAPENKPPRVSYTITLPPREPKPPKPPRIEYIAPPPPRQCADGVQRDAKYHAIAYTPKGEVTRKGHKSKAELYAELQAAVLNTPGSRRT